MRLFLHQKEALEWMTAVETRRRTVSEMECRGGVLAMPPGCGKTLTTLSFIASRPSTHTLVIVPKSLIFQWVSEAKRVQGLNTVVYHGSHRHIPDTSSVLVCSTYETARLDERLRAFPWGRIVVDEAHRIAEPTSKTARVLMKICAPNRWCLTGTPFKNGVSDLEALARFLNVFPYASPRWWRLNGTKQSELHRWRDQFVFTADKDVLQLPPKTENVFYAERSDTERELDAELMQSVFSQQLLVITRQRLIANHPLLFFHASVVMRTINQASGCVHCGSASTDAVCGRGQHAMCAACLSDTCAQCVYERLLKNAVPGEWPLHSAKTWIMWQFLKTRFGPGHKIVVFSQWTTSLDLIAHMLAFYHVGYVQYDGRIVTLESRAERLETFRTNDAVSVILISLSSGGEGVNLAFATHVLLMEPYWNEAMEQQAVDRLHRIGQTNLTVVSRFVTRDSIEEWVVQVQHRKTCEREWVLENGTPPRRMRRPVALGSLDAFIDRR